MNKKVIIGGVVALLVVLMVALLFVYRDQLDEPVQPDDPSDISDEFVGAEEDTMVEMNDFRVLLPQGWYGYEDYEDMYSAVMVTGTEEEMMAEGVWTEIAIQRFPAEGRPLEEHVDELRVMLDEQADFMEEGEEMTIVRDEETTLLGYSARYVEVNLNAGINQLISAAVFAEIDDYIWNISINLPTEEWEEQEELFQRVVDSFELK